MVLWLEEKIHLKSMLLVPHHDNMKMNKNYTNLQYFVLKSLFFDSTFLSAQKNSSTLTKNDKYLPPK